MGKRLISIRIDENLLRELERLAVALNKSRTELIENSLRSRLRRRRL